MKTIEFDNVNVFDIELDQTTWDWSSGHFVEDDRDSTIIYFNPPDCTCVVGLKIVDQDLYLEGTDYKVGKLTFS